MFANVKAQYVFETIDSALVSEFKAGPQRGLVCLIGLLVGVILGALLVLVFHFVRNSNNSNN